MKRRSFFSVLAAVVAALVLSSVIGFVGLWAQSPLGLLSGAPQGNPTAAMFVPKQAPLMAALLVNPDRLVALRQLLARPADRRSARTEFAQFQQSLLADADLIYETDIKPWLGDEITLAITSLDSDRDPGNGQQPGYLLAVKTQDAERAREFLQLFWQKRAIAGTDLQFEQYKGAQLISGHLPILRAPQSNADASRLPTTAPPLLATAVVGRQFVLFANSPKVLRDAINNVQAAELSLVSDRVYQRALASLTGGRIGLAFVNLPQLAAWHGQAPQATKAVATYESVAVSLGLDRQGMVAETALVPTPGRAITPDQESLLTKPVGALQYIPTASPMVAAGQDLAHLWAGINQGLSGYDAIAQLINQPLQDWQRRWQLQLTQDIFAWVKGDYALGLIPPVTAKSAPALDWAFVVNRVDSPDAAAGIAHLDDIAKQQGLTAVALPLNDQTVSAWTKLSAAATRGKTATNLNLQADVAAVHASVGDYELFTNSVAAMDQVLKSTASPLASQPAFKRAIAPLLTPNNGYLYVDWGNGKATLEQRLPLLQVLELAGQPFFSHLRSLSLSSYGNQAGIQRGGLFIRLS
jgi:Protein of unknown function (DUF3352)